MASSVSAVLLKQLSAASQTLNEATDHLNDQIKTIEEALGSYNLGVRAWAHASSLKEKDWFEDGTMYEFTRDISIGYDKENGKWCLMVSSFIQEFEHYEKWILRDAPRERRMQALDGIPKLLEKLIAEALKLADQVSAKTLQARTLAESIRPKVEAAKPKIEPTKPKKGQ
jgi:hypothetical protein